MGRLSRQPCEARVEGFTHGGEGVARVDGKAVFVAGALPGERVRMEVVDDRRRWARGRLLSVVEPAADRVDPPCPHAGTCGGCDLQHVSPEGQLALKTRVVVEQLQRLGRVVDPPVVATRAVGPALGYRSIARFHAGRDGRLGFHRAGSNDVVAIATCPVLTEGAQSVRTRVGDHTGALEVTVRATTGGDRAAVLTAGPSGVDVPAATPPDTAPLAVGVRGPDGSGPAPADQVTVTERIAGRDHTVTADGFFQANTGGAEALVSAVQELVGDLTAVSAWDLYAGVGLFTLPLAAAGARVTAVEGVGRAVEHLRTNADRAGMADGVTGVVADVARFVRQHPGPDPELVVLDPPRTGAGRDVVADLARRRPDQVVYVACDPAALARDTRALAEHGYELVLAQPFDLFPMTHHVEVVANFLPR